MAGFASTVLNIGFTDLEPGASLGLSVVFSYGTHGGSQINLGLSKEVVDANGVLPFVVSLHSLTQGHQGTAKVWVRSGDNFDDPPVKYVSGADSGKDALFTKHLP